MIRTAKPIIIKDAEGEVLKSFTFQERDLAFNYLKDLEQWGVEATLEEPSLPESLITSLGASQADKDILKQAIAEEIDDHDDSCCFQSSHEKK